MQRSKKWTIFFLMPLFMGSSPVESNVKTILKNFETLQNADSPACAPSATPTANAEALNYQCKIIPLGETELPPLIKNKKKGDEITLFQDNDNTLLMFMEYGDDVGYTNGMGVSYVKQLDQDKHPEKNKNITFDVTSELYTAEKSQKPAAGSGKNYRVNFIDVNRFKATYSEGKSFYFLMGVGIEDRQTKMTKKNKLTPSTAIQEKWHEIFDLDLNQYDPAEQSAAKRFSRTSIQLNAGAGKKTVLYEGRCELQAAANVSISTEDKTLVGQNSFASVDGSVKGNISKNKNGDPRFSAGLDGSMMFFPKGASDVKQVGARARLLMSGNFAVGKKSSTLQPFITFTLPVGRQIFSPMTDNDVLQRVGIRFIFGK